MLSDFLVLGVVWGLGILAERVSYRVGKVFLSIISAIFSFFYLLETVISFLFHVELNIQTVGSLAQDAFIFFPGIVRWGIAGMAWLFCVISFLISRKQVEKAISRLGYFILGTLCVIVITGVLAWFVSPFPSNMFTTNGKLLFSRLPEVGEFNIFGKHTSYQDYFRNVKGGNQRPNILILFAESLSPIDSLRVGGLYDHMPHFDRISSEGITFTNFVNNGCTSDTAHVALLRGIEPLGKASYTGFQTYIESLPDFLKNQGYSTTFLSAVSLDFFGQKAFLEEMHFDEIIGEEAFADHKKYVFDAAPDGDLYAKALELIRKKEENNRDPYALIFQSISFHKPYTTPYGDTEELAIQYSDEMLWDFYDTLKAEGFFNNGLLIIVGDHRKMTAEVKWEQESIGDMRHARGVATVVGTGISPWIESPLLIQDTDFFYWLRRYLATGDILVSELYNDPFDGKTAGRERWFMHDNCNSQRAYSLVQIKKDGKFSRSLQDLYSDSEFGTYFPHYLQFQQWNSTDSHCDSQQIIAHAGGKIADFTYTNTLEALNLSYAKGARLFELDILETSDGKLVAGHDRTMVKKNANFSGDIDDTPLSESEFMALQPYQPLAFRSYQLYTPLNIQRINQRFNQHSDTILITDKFNEPLRLAEGLTFTGRVMMEVFSRDAVKEAKEVWIIPIVSENLLFTTKNILQKLQDYEITRVAISRRSLDKYTTLLEQIKGLGIKIYVFHVNFDEGKDEKWVLENEIGKQGTWLAYGMYADDLEKVRECLYPEV